MNKRVKFDLKRAVVIQLSFSIECAIKMHRQQGACDDSSNVKSLMQAKQIMSQALDDE